MTYRPDMPPAEKAAPPQEDTAMSEQDITARVAETVARLRDPWQHSEDGCYAAADLLEALAARLAEVEAERVNLHDDAWWEAAFKRRTEYDAAEFQRRAEAAKAALDRLLAEAENRGRVSALEEAAKVAEYHDYTLQSSTAADLRAQEVAVNIRKLKTAALIAGAEARAEKGEG
jgi:hypothetical protein